MSPRAAAVPQWFTVNDVAARLKVNPQRVYEWIYSGRLESTRLPARGKGPGVHRISEDALAAFIKTCQEVA